MSITTTIFKRNQLRIRQLLNETKLQNNSKKLQLTSNMKRDNIKLNLHLHKIRKCTMNFISAMHSICPKILNVGATLAI